MLFLALEHLILYTQLVKYNLKSHESLGYYTNRHTLLILIATVTLIKLKELLRERSRNGKITILSSHVLDFVKDISTKVVFIKEGRASLENINMQEIEQIYLDMFS